MKYLNKYGKRIVSDVLKAYLIDGLSHRKIQERILNMEAPARGGGFEAMNILHEFGITGEYKGILKRFNGNINNKFPECINQAINFIES
ncbi:MAG: hypothetical protein GX568_00150 [Candidatus Gastranaerophilales bacterium]|nr:hypothetical protein [Candidatus Gastranaerophilales bacterium]